MSCHYCGSDVLQSEETCPVCGMSTVETAGSRREQWDRHSNQDPASLMSCAGPGLQRYSWMVAIVRRICCAESPVHGRKRHEHC